MKAFVFIGCLLACIGTAGAGELELKPADHIAIVGNTLADRMQHDGWLETYLHARFPKHELVVRNLGFSGDEVALRLRSMNFGSPDEWLTRTKADVIFAFFGYGESFGGAEGLPQFKGDLADFVKRTKGQNYSGKEPARVVLFSPIAHENIKDRNLPDEAESNRRLEMYTQATADVAKELDVGFVDLFHPTMALYPKVDRPLTINGVHLNSFGNQQLARIVDDALFAKGGGDGPQAAALEKLRQAVLEKSFFWFERYRTVDGYSIYGGRADLKFVGGQTNRVVMQREMQVLDVMTANRDKKIWAAAQGKDYVVDDSNTPPFIPVVTNKPGPLPGGKHVFLDGEEAISKMKLAKGLKANLFASEKQFPELVNPVQMSWDTKGRLWVAVWRTYPHWKPKEEMDDRLLILEDTDGDGKADKCSTFAGGLHCPTGFEFYNGGVLIAQQPDIMYLKDTDGDDKADERERVIHGMDSADTHHAANSFVLDPGGALYFQEGTFHHTQVETPWGPTQRCANAGVFRYEPRTQKFEVYVTHGFANPHGHVFDRWGQDIVVDGTGAVPYHAALFSGRLNYPVKHASPPPVYQQRTRPCPGMEYLSSKHFPESNQGNLIVGNVIGFQGLLQYKIRDEGSSFGATEVEPILSSTDVNFRPSDVKMGPDGAIYFLDWHNPIIGHMQHNLRDPSRDREHGRVYRITCEGRALSPKVAIAGEPIEKLLDLLKEPEDRIRYRARIELGGRATKDVVAAAGKWIAALDKNDKDFDHHLLEGLWLYQSHNTVNAALLDRVLASPDFRSRAAAARVLCYWRDRVSGSLDRLKRLAADSHPRVRLEAVRAASFYDKAEALEVALITADQPTDQYIAFVRTETMKALNPVVRRAIASGQRIQFTTPAGARYFLRNVGTDDLLKLERTPEVYRELLLRPGVREEYRREALSGLAKLEKKSEVAVLLDAVRYQDAQTGEPDESVVIDLLRLLTERSIELVKSRAELVSMAQNAKLPVTRQLGFVALIAADGKPDGAWTLANASPASLMDLVNAVPWIRDPVQKSALYPNLEALLSGLPSPLASKSSSNLSNGRYVRVELPGPFRTLTLAEVEVFSDGRNIARQGKASQKDTAHGGDAIKGIDGNKSDVYGAGGQTHSVEGTKDPWWEVDLRSEQPIEKVVVFNRGEGALGSRLKNFTLKVLDQDRKVVFEKSGLPTPKGSASFVVGGNSPERSIRRAAMASMSTIRGQEVLAFKAISKYVGDPADQSAAVAALLRIPTSYWPAEEAKPLLETMLTFIRRLPVSDRTTPTALDAMQLSESLAGLLPTEEARRVRRELSELGVKVVRLGTVTDQMRYDKEQIVVQAGKPFEILFENGDLMPHNVVLVQPGALEEIGTQAEAMATKPGAVERQYVPISTKILSSSRLLPPRDSQRMSLTAPTQPGVYPYVCTYPGHWRRMFGGLYVVEDLEQYLADPEAYVAKYNLVPKDELLKLNRPRKEWKYEELATEAGRLEGRSFGAGKLMFQTANCIACHRMNGAGQEFGPDLTKLDPKPTAADLWRSMIEPSHKIADKFATFAFELESGQTISGMILEESKTAVKVVENPLAKAQPTVLKTSEIVSRSRSATSLMPKGLLDKLTRDEILDLIAYIAAKGDAQHPIFKEGHEHSGHGTGH